MKKQTSLMVAKTLNSVSIIDGDVTFCKLFVVFSSSISNVNSFKYQSYRPILFSRKCDFCAFIVISIFIGRLLFLKLACDQVSTRKFRTSAKHTGNFPFLFSKEFVCQIKLSIMQQFSAKGYFLYLGRITCDNQ